MTQRPEPNFSMVDLDAALKRAVELTASPTIPPHAFTVRQYAEAKAAAGETVSENAARAKLKALVRDGVLREVIVAVGGKMPTAYFWFED